MTVNRDKTQHAEMKPEVCTVEATLESKIDRSKDEGKLIGHILRAPANQGQATRTAKPPSISSGGGVFHVEDARTKTKRGLVLNSLP